MDQVWFHLHPVNSVTKWYQINFFFFLMSKFQVHTLQQAAAMFESLTQSRIDSEMAKAQIEFEKTQRARVDDMLKMQTLLDEQSETLVALRQQQTETEVNITFFSGH
jgi:hypothetical protein